jgi:hypothetical protein
MATVSRWAIFIRAFLITLLAGTPARVGSATPDEAAAWSTAAQSDSVAAYYDYLSRYPAGEYVDRAIAALIRLGAINRAAPPTRTLPQQPASTPRAPGATPVQQPPAAPAPARVLY